MKKLFLILLFIFPGWLMAQNFPEKPSRLVNDYTQTLSANEIAALEQKLVAFDDSTSSQIAVVLINDLEGYDVNDYAVRLAEKWGIGQQKKNNGIIILASLGDRKVSIQTGYGLEGALPDAIAKRIIEYSIKPYFKQGEYYAGLDQATNDIIAYTKGEYKNDDRKPNQDGGGFPFILIPLIILMIVMLTLKKVRQENRRVISGRGGSGLFWWLLMNNGRGGNDNDFGGGFGGGGGGGFGGFGGGSFGGGGASGSW